ncbi:hypothetical protein ACIOZM_06910 [Pseudomonas sp. NPDC087346]|uniref:hypothetical protein n=1 Tax=Pseudomonas sp. NPDC087346 TaxID=3364438 RepID=UPI00380F2568
MASNAKVNTEGTFKVKTDPGGALRADTISFKTAGYGFEVSVAEGRGGNMEPKKYFRLVFPKRVSGTYKAQDLEGTKLLDYSEIHSYEYVPVSGSVEVTYVDSPERTQGNFNMEMRNIGEPSGPSVLKVEGSFDLKND